MRIKKDISDFDNTIPPFVNGNGGDGEDFACTGLLLQI